MQASDREIVWVFRICVVIVGALGTIIALTVQNVYGLLVLCGDLMAVSQFPQLVCALWLKVGNTYGSLLGMIVGLLMRILGGDQVLGIQAVIHYPYFDPEHNKQIFPFKIIAMLCSLAVIILVSHITHFIFTRNYLSKRFDIFNCFQDQFEKEISTDQHENSVMFGLDNENPSDETVKEKASDAMLDNTDL